MNKWFNADFARFIAEGTWLRIRVGLKQIGPYLGERL